MKPYMNYTESFAGQTPESLLLFAQRQAPALLGANGNGWLRLIDVSVAGARRAGSFDECQSYVKVVRSALDGLKRYTQIDDLDWASLAIRARVSCFLACSRYEEGSAAEALELFAIFADQIHASESGKSTIRGMAVRLARIAEYLPAEQQIVLRQWIA
jgi:hypothetical protein